MPEVLSTRYVSGEETLFEGIYKLLPGHLLVFEHGEIRTRQYWDVPTGRSAITSESLRSTGDVVARFRELLEESIRLRLMSDVPLGMFLSGGIDSSAVAALMAKMIGRPLQTFSVAFEDRAFNELEYAREVARAIEADAHEVVVGDRDFFDALPRMVWHEDEPIAHPSSVPLYFVSALARRHVTVVLTGEGSDELLAGYGKYPRITWNWRAGTVYERLLPRPVRQAVAHGVVPRLPALHRPVRAPIVPRDGPHARIDAPRQLRVDPPGGPAAAAVAVQAVTLGRRRKRTARRSLTSIGRTARARSSIGCSTPTSRRIWSNC